MITDADILIDNNSPDWTCIYCGQQWPPTEPVAVLQAHVLECKLHPASRLTQILADITRAETMLARPHEHRWRPDLVQCGIEQDVLGILREILDPIPKGGRP